MALGNSQSLSPPPASALPSLPTPKVRSGLPTSQDTSKLPTSPQTNTKIALRTLSKTTKAHDTYGRDQSKLSPLDSVPRSNTTVARSSDTNESEVRRSVSIASFPQPPKVRKRPATNSRPFPSATWPTLESNIRKSEDSGIQRILADNRKVRKIKSRPSTDHLSHMYANAQLSRSESSSGSGKHVAGEAELRTSDGMNSLHSPPHSRSSSAQGSYSTSATTFEDVDEHSRKGRDTADGSTGSVKTAVSPKESKGNVIVSVRVRPDAAGSGDAKNEGEWLVDGRRSLVSYRGRETAEFFYDNVFAIHDKNHKVYESAAKRLVRRVMEGYHGTVFAYGMTGTGKTFSMQGTASSPGVIPLAITDIFSYIRETPHREFLLRVSYLEIYNEKIHDLLSSPVGAGTGPGTQPEEIKLREDSKRGVYATPLKEEIVQSPTQLLRVIARGDHSRRTRSTQYNAQSSRSHAVVQIVVESRARGPGNGGMPESKRAPLMPGGVRVSTLSMIDLAGSEKAAENKERRTEGAHINKSLLTLGTVIARLSGEKDNGGNPTDKEGKHLPYRDSKLTRLLQPALSGNSLVSILCTIQIGSVGSVVTATGHTGETLSTLKFAARAKNNIVSHAKRAEEALGSGGDAGSKVLLERYRMEIQSLRHQLDVQGKAQSEADDKRLEKEAEQRHEEQMLEMQLARTALKERIEHLNRLILSSKSLGVNSNNTFSSFSVHPKHVAFNNHDPATKSLKSGDRSLHSSASYSTLGAPSPLQRTVSTGSTATAAASHGAGQSSTSSNDNECEDDSTGELGDGMASAHAHIRALQTDLANKNRYISTLEKRLLQARRWSQSRASTALSPSTPKTPTIDESRPVDILQEKDAEIADLRARLDDRDRMVMALRSAARKREVAELSSEPTFPPNTREQVQQRQSRRGDSQPEEGVGNAGQEREGLAPGAEMESKLKSADEVTVERVGNGQRVQGLRGLVRMSSERKADCWGAVPLEALAASLRPVSVGSEMGTGRG
ncbi:MAG: hypothetical protein Q9167_002557 [Letrouitia subvulpina]